MAQYPTSAATDANLYVAVNSKSTTLAGALTSSGGNNGADIEVVDTTGFPSSGFITIDQEAISYTSILSGPPRFSGIVRGADGTTATAHSDGSTVKHNVIAAHHNAPKDEIIAVENDLVAARGALNDNDTPASTSSDIKDRLDHIATQIKRGNGLSNWYDVITRKGQILQIVTATYSTNATTTSTTYSDTGLTASITPGATSSKIFVFVAQANFAGRGVVCRLRMVRDSTTLATFMGAYHNDDDTLSQFQGNGASLIYVDSPATTSPTVYKTQFSTSSGGVTVGVNGDGSTAYDNVIILVEVGQ